MSRITVSTLKKMKDEGKKISSITAYDASFAKIFDDAGMHVMLVGDSLGMVLQGQSDTIPVTVDDIAYHTRCVRSGAEKTLLIADMPFMSYATKEQAFANAAKLMQAGANMVKVEGGEWLFDTIAGLVERSVPVCGHLGLTPQSVNVFGGFKVQGRDNEKALQMIEDAKKLEQAGIQLLVLECIPTELAKAITQAVSIPVIGIGAGNVTDGQILVMHDALGISFGKIPKFSRNFLAETGDIRQAVELYMNDVSSGQFPSEQHSFQ
ncbi:3-methyl-2-oxobutanoate hydroxymethyltransferase [Thalassotalea aquiviva]|uniref:3-methyl-2-oxobutanoate hydroxymethyltransferase n=1 Tax=Thalassotalea aquiviva TaxID=3242415 RepID=UPI00352BCE8A